MPAKQPKYHLFAALRDLNNPRKPFQLVRLVFRSQSRKEKRRFLPAARPRLPIYFLGERPEGFEDVPILEPLKGINWRQQAEAIRLLLQVGVP